MKSTTKAELEKLRKQYPAGTRLILRHMNDTQSPPFGTLGTVTSVDSVGQIHMAWDNGSTLALVPDLDSFYTVKEALVEKAEAEQKRFEKSLLKMKPEDILWNAAEYAIRQDILFALQEMAQTDFPDSAIEALWRQDDPLAGIYATWKDVPNHYLEGLNNAAFLLVNELMAGKAESEEEERMN